MNKPITNNEITNVIKKKKKLLPKKSPGQDGFTRDFYQIFGDELMPILLKHLPKNLA